jgi:hypothetical protein
VAKDWRSLRNEVIYNLYFSRNIIKVIKLERMRWKKWEMLTKFYFEKLQKIGHLGDIDAVGKMKLKLISKKI